MPELIYISDDGVRFGAPGADQFDSDNYYIRSGTGDGDFPFVQGKSAVIVRSGNVGTANWQIANWKYDANVYTTSYTAYGSAISHTTTTTMVKIK